MSSGLRTYHRSSQSISSRPLRKAVFQDERLSRIQNIGQRTTPSDYGWKAYWLSWLFRQGYPVPKALFLPAISPKSGEKLIRTWQSMITPKVLAPFRVGTNYGVAIRSSATIEDTEDKSMAGHFKSFLGLMDFERVIHDAREVINSLAPFDKENRFRMGVVVQKLVAPSYSGVLFSSNPVTASKRESIINIIRGEGGPLVSGRQAAEDITVSFKGRNPVVGKHNSGIQESILRKVSLWGKAIEAKLDTPVDIEWCVETPNSRPLLLQVRPATGIFPSGPSVVPVTLEHKSELPKLVAQNPKVLLRLEGESDGILVSPATVAVMKCSNRSIIPSVNRLGPSDRCKGYSVVLIYPQTLAGKVVRMFQRPRMNSRELELFLEGCRRYKIRTYPQMGSLQQTLEEIAENCTGHSWLGIVIIQEIYDPTFTGVVRRISDGYAVELAFGHFVPKGIVSTSQYVTDLSGSVTHVSEVHQGSRLRIFDGHVVEEKLFHDDSLVTVSQATIRRVIRTFAPILNAGKVSVEFGVLPNSEGRRTHLLPYLIDFVDDSVSAALSTTDFLDGVISRGKRVGVLLSPPIRYAKPDPLDFHFYDTRTLPHIGDKSVVFLCERPDISLLNLVTGHSPQRIGFVFREGSMLCHLAIILREKGIPAVIVGESEGLMAGEEISLDCTTPGLKPIERVAPINRDSVRSS